MEVRPGYKRTEVGVIPEDWEVKTIDDLFAFLSTSSCSRSDLNENGEVFYIHYGDIHTKWDYRLDFDLDSVPLIMKEKVKNATLLADGDLVLVDASEDEEGSGKGVEVVNLKGRSAVAGLHTIALRCKSNELADGFKAYIQSMSVVRNQIRRLITGLKVFGISKTNLASVIIVFPPLPEQRAIAAVLSDVDALIAALDRLIAKKCAIKQGAMQQLLTGKTRLPGFSGAWEVKRLGDVCKITTGSKDVNEGNPNGEFPFFTCSRSITYSDTYSFDTEAILIAGNGDVGTRHYYRGKFEAYQRTYVLDKFQVNVGYIDQYLEKNLIPSLVVDKIGTSIPYIKLGNLQDFEVAFPVDKREIKAIATVLSDMDAEIVRSVRAATDIAGPVEYLAASVLRGERVTRYQPARSEAGLSVHSAGHKRHHGVG